MLGDRNFIFSELEEIPNVIPELQDRFHEVHIDGLSVRWVEPIKVVEVFLVFHNFFFVLAK